MPLWMFTSTSFQQPLTYKDHTLQYDVTLNNSTIGYLNCTKRLYDGSPFVIYIIDSKVNVNVIKSYNVHYTLYTKYLNEKIYYSKLINVVNADTQKFNQVSISNGYYHFHQKDKIESTTHQMINYSVGKLYHHEPTEATHLFTENFLAFCPIVKNESNYSITFPDGNTNTYTYVDGICNEAKIQQKWFTLYFKKKT
ncbi:MAG: DUF6134 family protein [Cytophagaceae bacterium]